MPVNEFIRMNADPIWLHQNGLWEYMDESTYVEDSDEISDEEFDFLRWAEVVVRTSSTVK